jgi:spore germination protein GerM
MSRRSFRSLLALVAAATVVVTLTGCGDDNTASVASASSTSSSSDPATTTTTTTVARIYLLKDGKVAAVRRDVPSPAVAKGALDALVQGPTADEAAQGFSTAVSSTAVINAVTIDQGVATVDLPSAFITGADASSLGARVAQVVFTVTQFDTVTGVRFLVDGQPVTSLGETIPAEEPRTRGDFEAVTPAILVETPLPGDHVGSPLTISGSANTFEANVRYRVLDHDGKVLDDSFTTATSGSGTRGTFHTQSVFSVATHGTGSVEVFEESAADGSKINVVTVPVEL